MFSFLYQGSHCFGAFGIDGRVVAIHPQYLSIVMPCGIKMRKILKNKIKSGHVYADKYMIALTGARYMFLS